MAGRARCSSSPAPRGTRAPRSRRGGAILDAFGDHADAERAPKSDDGLDDGAVARLTELHDKGPVDLDLVHGQPALDRSDEGIVFVGAPGVPDTLFRYLETDTGRDLSAMRDAGRLVLSRSSADVDEHLENMRQAAESTIARGAKTVRMMANVELEAPEWPYPEDVLWIESHLNVVFRSLPAVMICAYDVMRMPGLRSFSAAFIATLSSSTRRIARTACSSHRTSS